jgi:uracil-DNA glycosylase family protein
MSGRPRDSESAAWDLIPDRPTLTTVREASRECRACGLWRNATQTVFGEGLAKAEVMMVGEQPGDQEDRAGRPFVGPAGKVLDRALTDAGIDRRLVYLTNVVKHFKFEPRGKRRIHKKPAAEEIAACRPWLETELRLVRPRVLVCLGATAAQALLGRTFRLTHHRRELVPSDLAPVVTATVHPSSILRAPDDLAREQAYEEFVRDLRMVARQLGVEGGANAEAG